MYYGLQDAAPNTNVLESAYKENRKITTGKNVHSSYFVHNGDFMKLDVATLGYTWNINNKWVERHVSILQDVICSLLADIIED